ncbi:presequence protease, mitochondrial [Strongylocentrotus purpuratus]|uniref:Presequence protease, mitochondrial n=1 Tax=Strongylocentrotus purpuratus TaxID=7668 RepID=A0A7M7RFD1_STRPU|nr:presequence protease, mitochondrial [Strongylocentrotus purpuratus]|eukprot:XP_792865.3 PREDICTED: presequence protease, mitochondrial [Strongylocentrotus purpuratus]
MLRAAISSSWSRCVLKRRLSAEWRRSYAVVSKAQERAKQYQPGDRLHGFSVEKVVPVPELYLTAVQLRHDKTGAQYLHVAREDTNNVFSVGFRTTPMDSTGVSHILEHTVLCGSQNYPVRDPFFKMLNRSLSTFMNAWTASDYTMYPFSTQNGKDFENLLSVYLDAVFFPRLRQLDFMQEGWRLENEVTEDQSTPIAFKGVVFNEMKGAMSGPDQLFAHSLQSKLLPSHTYSHNSGGEPIRIPDLTWDQLKQFHASHYHPSNSRFYTYGDLPLERHLELIEEKALSHFERLQPHTEVPNESRWASPREHTMYCPPDPMAPDPNKQTTLAASYVIKDVTDAEELVFGQILGSLLVDGPTAPFYHSLIGAGIGSDYAPCIGYSSQTRDSTFSIGLRGLAEEDVDRVKKIIEDTIAKVIRTGFEPERIEAILHKIELSNKHQSTQFGLGVAAALMPSWNHGNDPSTNLKITQLVDSFKAKVAADPNYLQSKVKEYFQDNQHKLWLTMKPQEDYVEEQEREEKEKLDGMVAKLTETDKMDIYERGLELAEEQKREEDMTCLPSLKVSDIDAKAKRTAVETRHMGGVHTQFCEQPTNGITYFRAMFTPDNIPDDLQIYLPLFCNVITKMGAGELDFIEFAQKEELKTGGISTSRHIAQYHSDVMQYEQGIGLSSFCLDRNLPDMFDLLLRVFTSPRLNDMERLATLVRMEAAELANSIVYMGHAFAMKRAGSSLSPSGRLHEIAGGMTQVSFLKGLAEKENLDPVLAHLQTIASLVLNKTNMRCAVNSSPEGVDQAANQLTRFLDNLPGSPLGDSLHLTQASDFSPSEERMHYELPFPVNYMSHAVCGVPYSHPDFPKLRVLARLMSAKYLHREIREKGGAYGGGASMGTEGAFKFYSYRDPNTVETMSAFESSVQWALDGKFTQQDIDEAKLSVFSVVDSPLSPAEKGATLFSTGIDNDMKQETRDALFAVTKDDLRDVAERYLMDGKRTHATTLLGPTTTMTSQGWNILKE